MWSWILISLIILLFILLLLIQLFITNNTTKIVLSAVLIVILILLPIITTLIVNYLSGDHIKALAADVLKQDLAGKDPKSLLETCDLLFAASPELTESYQSLRTIQGDYSAATLCRSHSRTLLGIKT